MSESESAESEVSELSASDFAASGLSASESSVADSLVSESVVSESASAESEVAESSASDSLVSDSLVSASSAASDVAVSESSEALSDVLTDAGSAADARVGADMTTRTTTSPQRAAVRTTIRRRSGSSRARSVVSMPVTSRRTSSKGDKYPQLSCSFNLAGHRDDSDMSGGWGCRAIGGATNIEGSSAAAAVSPPGGGHTAPRTMASLTISSPLRRRGHLPDRRSETSFHSN